MARRPMVDRRDYSLRLFSWLAGWLVGWLGGASRRCCKSPRQNSARWLLCSKVRRCPYEWVCIAETEKSRESFNARGSASLYSCTINRACWYFQELLLFRRERESPDNNILIISILLMKISLKELNCNEKQKFLKELNYDKKIPTFI